MSDSDGSSFPEGCSYIIKLWPLWLVLAVMLLVVLVGQSIGNVVEVTPLSTPQPTDDVGTDDTGADGIGTAVDEFTQVDWPGVCASAYVLPVVMLVVYLLRNG